MQTKFLLVEALNLMRKLFSVLALMLALCPLAGRAAEIAWQYDDTVDGVKIWSRQEPDRRLKTWRSEITLPGPLSRIVEVLETPQRFPEWWYLCASYVELNVSEDRLLRDSYMISDLPWPYGHRDTPVRVRTMISDDHKWMTVTSETVADLIPVVSDYVRVADAINTMTFTVQPDGRVLFEFVNYQDPGDIPAALVNRENRKTMYKNLTGLEALVQSMPGGIISFHKFANP